MDSVRELNTPEDGHSCYEQGPASAPKSRAEDISALEATFGRYPGMAWQNPRECNGLQSPNQISSQEVTVNQTGVQPHTEHSRNMTQHQPESSEELEGCLQFKSQNSGETDSTNNQNEVGGRKFNPDFYGIFSRKKNKECGESTKNGKIPVENCSPSDTITTEAHNNSSDILADAIHKEGISEVNTITFAETGSAYKESDVLQSMNYKHFLELIQRNLGCSDSASIQPGIPMTNTWQQESAVGSSEFKESAFIQPDISVPSPSVHTLQSGYNKSSLIQLKVSAPSTFTQSCGKTVNNLSCDDQHEMTDGLSRYDGDLNEESEVGTKRKNRKRMKSKQSEAEKKKKLAEKSKQNRIRKNEEFASLRQSNKTLKNEIQTLQNQNQTLKNQNHEKDRIIASLTPNQGMSENVPNNPQSASAENKLDEKEFTEMMHQASVEAFDHEKFLKLMNNWFRSKGRSEIRVNDRESTAGVVRVERGEQKMKIRVLKYYRKMESDKERYKKCKEDHEHNGLE